MNARIVITGDNKGRPYELSMILDEDGKLVSLAGVIKAAKNRAFYYEPERPMSLERYGEKQRRLCFELMKFLHRGSDHDSKPDSLQRAARHRKQHRIQTDKTSQVSVFHKPEK